MKKYLVKLASHLDKKGFHKEADYVDWILKMAMDDEATGQIFNPDDFQKEFIMRKCIFGMSDQDAMDLSKPISAKQVAGYFGEVDRKPEEAIESFRKEISEYLEGKGLDINNLSESELEEALNEISDMSYYINEMKEAGKIDGESHSMGLQVMDIVAVPATEDLYKQFFDNMNK